MRSLLWAGQRFELGLDLYDYRARFYDPLAGSFISPDTIIPDPSNPAAWNRYSYVYGNPVRYTDPTGHCVPCRGVDDPINAELYRTPGLHYDQYLAGKRQFYAYAAHPDLLLEDLLTETTDPAAFARLSPTYVYADYVEGVRLERALLSEQMIYQAMVDAENAGDEAQRMAAALLLVGFIGMGERLGGTPSPFDIVPYRPANVKYGLHNHHGVMDAWAKKNIPGYISRKGDAPTMALTEAQHKATQKEYWKWVRENGHGRAPDWSQVSPQEIQALSERMFDVAGVPANARVTYYRAFNQYIYSGKWSR